MQAHLFDPADHPYLDVLGPIGILSTRVVDQSTKSAGGATVTTRVNGKIVDVVDSAGGQVVFNPMQQSLIVTGCNWRRH